MSYNLEQLGCTPFQVDQFGPQGNGSYVYCTPSGSQTSCFQFQNPVDVWTCPSIPIPGVQNGITQPGVVAENAYLQNQAYQNGQAYQQNGLAQAYQNGQAYQQNGLAQPYLQGQAYQQNGLAQAYQQNQALQNGQVLLPGQIQGMAQNPLYGARTF
nr:hypothetical protein Clen_326 [Cedratvirus lena]